MYVRWKKKNRKRRYNESIPKVTLCAVIVRSQRINGKSKQKVVKYLGSIREEQVKYSYSRDIFWRNVRQKLYELDINTKDREVIIRKLREVVPEDKHTKLYFSPQKFTGE